MPGTTVKQSAEELELASRSEIEPERSAKSFTASNMFRSPVLRLGTGNTRGKHGRQFERRAASVLAPKVMVTGLPEPPPHTANVFAPALSPSLGNTIHW